MGTATRNCGTPGYQSPEQLKGTVKIPELCDVYAMGCVIIEVFGDKPLWEPGKSAWEIMYKVTVENLLPSVDCVPTNLVTCCKRSVCLEDKRIASIELLKLLVSAFVHEI